MHSVLGLIVTKVTRALCFVFDCYVSDSRSLFCVWLLRKRLAHSVLCLIVSWWLAHSVLCLIVTLVTRALCFLFDCYVSDSRTLFCIWLLVGESLTLFCVLLLRKWLAHSVLCLIVRQVTRALCFVFDCYVSDSRIRILFCVWLLRKWLALSVLCLIVSLWLALSVLSLIVLLETRALCSVFDS